MENLNPKDVKFQEGSLSIEWENGLESTHKYFDLRYLCPCAFCQDELTGKRTIQLEDVDEKIHARSAEAVGAYGMKIFWSDGHSTGIYTWDYLGSLVKE